MPSLLRFTFSRGLSALLAVLLAAGLAACAAPPDRPEFPMPRFDDRPPIALDVARLRIEQRYEPTLEPPFVEHLMPVSPGAAARQWAEDRLRAGGGEGRATFVITDASVKEIPLETTEGIQGWFTTEPAERYEARLEVRLEATRGNETGNLRVKAERATAVQEGASLNERETVWYELVTKLMEDFDAQMEESLSGSFEPFVRR